MKKHVLVFDTSTISSTSHDVFDSILSDMIRKTQKLMNPQMDKNTVINMIAANMGRSFATWPNADGERELQALLLIASHAVFNVVMLQSAFGEN